MPLLLAVGAVVETSFSTRTTGTRSDETWGKSSPKALRSTFVLNAIETLRPERAVWENPRTVFVFLVIFEQGGSSRFTVCGRADALNVDPALFQGPLSRSSTMFILKLAQAKTKHKGNVW
jgi:hypothetical protein